MINGPRIISIRTNDYGITIQESIVGCVAMYLIIFGNVENYFYHFRTFLIMLPSMRKISLVTEDKVEIIKLSTYRFLLYRRIMVVA